MIISSSREAHMEVLLALLIILIKLAIFHLNIGPFMIDFNFIMRTLYNVIC